MKQNNPHFNPKANFQDRQRSLCSGPYVAQIQRLRKGVTPLIGPLYRFGTEGLIGRDEGMKKNVFGMECLAQHLTTWVRGPSARMPIIWGPGTSLPITQWAPAALYRSRPEHKQVSHQRGDFLYLFPSISLMLRYGGSWTPITFSWPKYAILAFLK